MGGFSFNGVQQFIVAIYKIKIISSVLSVESADRNSPPIHNGNFRRRRLNRACEEEPEVRVNGRPDTSGRAHAFYNIG
jgi:hypothetical protein